MIFADQAAFSVPGDSRVDFFYLVMTSWMIQPINFFNILGGNFWILSG
jgi:hypothetical protein